MLIFNLTQHKETEDQIRAGVWFPSSTPGAREQLGELLTFKGLPTAADVVARAEGIAAFAVQYLPGGGRAMIGGAPYLMAPLERALQARGIQPVYAFSERVAVETPLPDGTVRKEMVFKHQGWVEVAVAAEPENPRS